MLSINKLGHFESVTCEQCTHMTLLASNKLFRFSGKSIFQGRGHVPYVPPCGSGLDLLRSIDKGH